MRLPTLAVDARRRADEAICCWGQVHIYRTDNVRKVVPGSRQEFDQTVDEYAAALATRDDYDGLLEAKCAGRAEDERRRPLDTYRVHELTEMSRDIYDDRHNFAAMRRAFVTKQPPRGPAVSAPQPR